LPARASPDCYRGRRDLLQRLFELIKMRVVLRRPHLARLPKFADAASRQLSRVERPWRWRLREGST
jgi:hypothetical protein